MESTKLPPIENSKNVKPKSNFFCIPAFAGSLDNDVEDDTPRKDSTELTYSMKGKRKKRFKSFKQVANVMAMNYKWTKQGSDEVHEDKSRHFVSGSGKEQPLTFNVSAFRAHVRSVGVLTPEVKVALTLSSWERTPADLNLIQSVVMRIKAFETYPLHLKTELPHVLMYQKFGSGRIVIQQGHFGLSFYFIVSGTVTVQREEKDDRTGEKHVQVLGEMCEGDAFGELALLQNSSRTATIICKTPCEFLKIDKEDFNQVLKKSQQFELEKKMSIFRENSYFKKWSVQEIRAANANSKVRVFPANSVILKDFDQEYIYFVQSGRCKIVREITVIKTVLPFGKSCLSLAPLGITPKLSNNRTLERRYLVIAVFGRGGYFGVGEDLEKAVIVSDVSKVECLLVSRTVFTKHDSGRDLILLRQEFMSNIPGRKEAFKSYLKERNWRKYRKSLVEDLIKRRCKHVSTTYEDVPDVIKRTHEHYVKKL